MTLAQPIHDIQSVATVKALPRKGAFDPPQNMNARLKQGVKLVESALKFIGLALTAVVLGVLCTSFAIGLMGHGIGDFASDGSNHGAGYEGIYK